ncbi:dynamin GTPase [Penicillium verrucosum]|uniref:dynamin GTPase n=1 Tax=Penicillium verrucosum TaxID=60171 RepID=UPI0025459129|nr:dynamin GTPase [Penicillium verrucosum]KAJ5942697.1 dynamin GTPase [Penicillium verrucosum]
MIREEDHLSIIDVLGIFKNTVYRVTTKDNIVLVRDIEIIEIAREIDLKGERTLPIMTKIDVVDQGT